MKLRLITLIGKAEKEDSATIKELACQWGAAFLDCGQSGIRGFQAKHLTPYAHVLTTHIAPMVAQVGGLDKFNGESLEKLNDEFKKTFLRQTNCGYIGDALRQHKRRELAVRKKEIQVKERQEKKPMKFTCQVSDPAREIQTNQQTKADYGCPA